MIIIIIEFLNKFFELLKRCCFGLQVAVKEITLKQPEVERNQLPWIKEQQAS